MNTINGLKGVHIQREAHRGAGYDKLPPIDLMFVEHLGLHWSAEQRALIVTVNAAPLLRVRFPHAATIIIQEEQDNGATTASDDESGT
jgi:hypothetical protein